MQPSPHAWRGPIEDGITQSILNDFMGCPKSAYIKLILCLEDDEPPHPNLIWGDSYHVGLEHLIRGDSLADSIIAMQERLTEYSTAPPSFKYSLTRMLRLYDLSGLEGTWQTEVQIDEHINGFRFRGKMDGICFDHPEYQPYMAEHKCKGYTDPILTKEEIKQDLQCNLYMFIHDCEWVAYDLIKIPDVQKYGPQKGFTDTSETYITKIYEGPVGSYGNMYPINKHRTKWIHQAPLHISKEEQEENWDQTIMPLVHRINEWYEHVTDINFDLDDHTHYNSIFYKAPVRHFNGRNTQSFKCPYHAYHTGGSLSDLRPIVSHFSELEE